MNKINYGQQLVIIGQSLHSPRLSSRLMRDQNLNLMRQV